jgi:hypothetical protein
LAPLERTLSGGGIALGKGNSRADKRRGIEHGGREPWRAGYVILPLAVVVGLCQLLIPPDLIQSVSAHLVPSHRDRPASSELPADQAAAATPSDVTIDANEADGATPPAAPAPVRVLIHHATGARNALPAMQLAAYLQLQGFVVDEIRPVESEVERPSVRYFFASDQPDSHRLVEAVDAFLAEAPVQAPAAADDFSHASPKPQPRSMEVLLPPLAAAGERRSS